LVATVACKHAPTDLIQAKASFGVLDPKCITSRCMDGRKSRIDDWRNPTDLHPRTVPSLPDDLPACAGCGLCCHLAVELRPGDDVPAEYVAEREGVRFLDQHGDGACVALDPRTRLCTIYDRRPQTCRDFARGEPLCRSIVIAARLKAKR
jgi:hypothetical protein